MGKEWDFDVFYLGLSEKWDYVCIICLWSFTMYLPSTIEKAFLMVLDLERNASLISQTFCPHTREGKIFWPYVVLRPKLPAIIGIDSSTSRYLNFTPHIFDFCFLFHFCIFESFHSYKFNNVFLNIIFLFPFIFLQGNFTFFVIDLSILDNHILISYKEIQMVPWLAFSLCYIGICKHYFYVWKLLKRYIHLSLLGYNSCNVSWINGTFFITVLPSYYICYYCHRQNLFLH